MIIQWEHDNSHGNLILLLCLSDEIIKIYIFTSKCYPSALLSLDLFQEAIVDFLFF